MMQTSLARYVQEVHASIEVCAIDNATRFENDTGFRVKMSHADIKAGTNRIRITPALIDKVRELLLECGYETVYADEVIIIRVLPIGSRKEVYTMDEIILQNKVALAKESTRRARGPVPAVGRD